MAHGTTQTAQITKGGYLKNMSLIFHILEFLNWESTNMTLLNTGDVAPDFTLQDQNENNISLSQFKGKWVALYFYPRAMTPGCTTQACELRDHRKELNDLNTVILGLSPDKPAALKKFEEKEKLNFKLLSDVDHKVANNYGAWQEKSMYGKKYMGMARMTYIINPEGVISEVMPKVKPKEHYNDIVEFIKSNQ